MRLILDTGFEINWFVTVVLHLGLGISVSHLSRLGSSQILKNSLRVSFLRKTMTGITIGIFLAILIVYEYTTVDRHHRNLPRLTSTACPRCGKWKSQRIYAYWQVVRKADGAMVDQQPFTPYYVPFPLKSVATDLKDSSTTTLRSISLETHSNARDRTGQFTVSSNPWFWVAKQLAWVRFFPQPPSVRYH